MKTLYLSALFLLLLLVSCTSGFEKTIAVDSVIKVSDLPPGRTINSSCRVRVENFTDRRDSNVIASVKGKEVWAAGSVPIAVRTAFEEMLRLNDISLSQFHGPRIKGEVREWHVEVLSDFPSAHAQANAAVNLIIKNEHHRILYSAVFTGSAERSHVVLSAEKASDLLGEAMKAALEAAFHDSEFLSYLRAAGRAG